MRWPAWALVGWSLAVAPAWAGEYEAGLLIGRPSPSSFPWNRALTGAQEPLEASRLGLRIGWNPFDLRAASVWFTASYQPSGGDNPRAASDSPAAGAAPEFVALGAQLDWTFLVNLHAGVDLRRERAVAPEGLPPVGAPGTGSMNTRPWLKAGVGYVLPSPAVQPFLRLEVAWAVSREVSPASPEVARKGQIPEFQVGLFGGLRF